MVTAFFRPVLEKPVIDDKSWLRSGDTIAADGGGGGIADGGVGGGKGGPPFCIDGVIGVLGVDNGDGESGIDMVSHDNNESDLIELDNEPLPNLLVFMLIFNELLNAEKKIKNIFNKIVIKQSKKPLVN